MQQQRLVDLEQSYAQGLISQDEYVRRRQSIISQAAAPQRPHCCWYVRCCALALPMLVCVSCAFASLFMDRWLKFVASCPAGHAATTQADTERAALIQRLNNNTCVRAGCCAKADQGIGWYTIDGSDWEGEAPFTNEHFWNRQKCLDSTDQNHDDEQQRSQYTLPVGTTCCMAECARCSDISLHGSDSLCMSQPCLGCSGCPAHPLGRELYCFSGICKTFAGLIFPAGSDSLYGQGSGEQGEGFIAKHGVDDLVRRSGTDMLCSTNGTACLEFLEISWDRWSFASGWVDLNGTRHLIQEDSSSADFNKSRVTFNPDDDTAHGQNLIGASFKVAIVTLAQTAVASVTLIVLQYRSYKKAPARENLIVLAISMLYSTVFVTSLSSFITFEVARQDMSLEWQRVFGTDGNQCLVMYGSVGGHVTTDLSVTFMSALSALVLMSTICCSACCFHRKVPQPTGAPQVSSTSSAVQMTNMAPASGGSAFVLQQPQYSQPAANVVQAQPVFVSQPVLVPVTASSHVPTVTPIPQPLAPQLSGLATAGAKETPTHAKGAY